MVTERPGRPVCSPRGCPRGEQSGQPGTARSGDRRSLNTDAVPVHDDGDSAMTPRPASASRGFSATTPRRLLYALLGLPLGVLGVVFVMVTIVVGSALSLTVV